MPSPRVDALRATLLAPFAADPRSLAAFRLLLGLIVAVDVVLRWLMLDEHYSDAGVLPRIVRIRVYDYGATGLEYWWSLHFMSGERWGLSLLFAIHLAAALALAVGWRTRWATAIAFVMTASIQSRNPVVCDGGDDLLRMLLFWAMFLPLGAGWSVDGRGAGPGSEPLRTLGAAALQLQVAGLYFVSAWMKTGVEWHPEYSATHYAVHIDTFATAFGVWVRQFPDALQALTWTTYWLEWLAPLLVFFPWKNARFRTLAIVGLCGFHFGTILSMRIGIFPYVAFCAWTALLPAGFWDGVLGRRLRGTLDRLATRGFARIPLTGVGPAPIGRLSTAFATAMLVYVGLWNVREAAPSWGPRVLPDSLVWIGRVTRTDQTWGMFGRPPRFGGWYEMRGTLADGTTVDLWNPNASALGGSPEKTGAIWGQRWRKFLLNLWYDDHARHRDFLADYLLRRWDATRAAGDPRKAVTEVEIWFHRLDTPPPGAGPRSGDATPQRLWPPAKTT